MYLEAEPELFMLIVISQVNHPSTLTIILSVSIYLLTISKVSEAVCFQRCN